MKAFISPQPLRAQLCQPHPMAPARVAQGPQQSITTQSASFPAVLDSMGMVLPQENVKKTEPGVANFLTAKVKVD